jgi:hypothetical protein
MRLLWLVLLIVQSITTSAYSIHIQECYSQKANLINNSSGVAWPGLVHNGTPCHLNSFDGFRAVTTALETKGPPIDNR